MPKATSGWSWFETAGSDDVPVGDQADDDNLPRLFAKTFQGRGGARVLAHLKAMTMERTLGPNTTDAMLRHLEGQRHLVSYILSLVERGSGRPLVTSVTITREVSTESNDD